MNHSDVRARTADYLEGHLALTDRALFDAHLDGCPDCAADVAELRATIATLRSLPEPVVPGDFQANVMRRIRTGEAEPGLLDRLAAFFESVTSPRILVPLSAAALSVGFVLWGQQAGVLTVPGQIGVDAAGRQADRVTAEVMEVAQTTLTQRDASNPVRLAGLAPASGEAPVARQGPVVQRFNLHIVLNDRHRPPYAVEGVPGMISPMPPRRVDRANTFTPRTYRGAEIGGGESLAVSSMGRDSSGHDAALRGAGVAVDPSYGIAANANGAEPPSRDDWLAILEANPTEFAARLSHLTLAEQELWVDRLARHAAAQGSLDRVVERLAEAGGPRGQVLAVDFAAVGASISDSSEVDQSLR